MLTPIPDLIRAIRPQLRTLSAADAMAERAQLPDSLVIDVREAEEVAAQPIPGSTPIPRGVLEMRMSAGYNDPERPIYIHCATGARATLAAEQLQRIGYRRVTVISCPLEQISTVMQETHA